MSFLSFRWLFLFVCIGILASQPYKVCGIRSKDLVLRWHTEQLTFVRSFRILKDDVAKVDDVKAKMDLAPAPSMSYDPNQSNKRTVKKGSDPIHNRSWLAIWLCLIATHTYTSLYTKPSLLAWLTLAHEQGWLDSYFLFFFCLFFSFLSLAIRWRIEVEIQFENRCYLLVFDSLE